METLELNKECIPGPLDMPNVRGSSDIFINYPPFVHP
jgi:hypothetical protein